MKHITLLLIIILIFSCSSEDEKSNDNNDDNYKIYKIKQTFSDDGSISLSEFNYKDGLLDFIKNTKNGNVNYTYYKYNSKKQIASIINEYSEVTFTYIGNNITKELKSYNIGSINETETEYRYNSNNLVESEKYYEDSQLIWELIFEYDNKNNLIKETELHNGTITGSGTQTFDNMKNPYKTSYPKELLVIYKFYGENNVLESFYDKNVYKYNDKDYPLENSVYESGVLESVIEFEYK